MINNNRNVLVYCLCFLLIFNLIFLPGFSDGQETGIFVEASFGVVILTFLFYRGFKFLFKKINTTILLECLILFLLSELAIFCMLGGEVCLFGIAYKLHYYDDTKTAADIILFREQRDFAFSMSFIISAVVCIIQNMIFRKRVSNIARTEP